MRTILSLFVILFSSTLAMAQEKTVPDHVGTGASQFNEVSNLPIEPIGRDDLIGINVYDSPELTRTVRVGAEGYIRLPMIKHPILALGLYPQDLEKAITEALVKDQVLTDPIVTVSVVEYRSRPISVSGSVKNPITFQATGVLTLLEAVSRADGLTENAGSEILVSKPSPDGGKGAPPLVTRIPVRALIDGSDPSLNLKLDGGEEIRVPEAGRIFVVGDVKRPGTFYIHDGAETTVLKALALSEGLDKFPEHQAYIYRAQAGDTKKKEIEVPLQKIMQRKSPDVALLPNDILYVPEAGGRKAALTILDRTIMISSGLGAAMIYTTR